MKIVLIIVNIVYFLKVFREIKHLVQFLSIENDQVIESQFAQITTLFFIMFGGNIFFFIHKDTISEQFYHIFALEMFIFLIYLSLEKGARKLQGC